MSLFSKVDNESLEKCKALQKEMHDAYYEKMVDMVDEHYNFDPDMVIYPMLDIFTEFASQKMKYKGKRTLLQHTLNVVGTSGNDKLKAHYFEVRNIFKNAVKGHLTDGSFQSDACLPMDTTNPMHRISYACADIIYSSLLSVDKFNIDEMEMMKIEFSDFALELADNLEEKHDELCTFMQKH